MSVGSDPSQRDRLAERLKGSARQRVGELLDEARGDQASDREEMQGQDSGTTPRSVETADR